MLLRQQWLQLRRMYSKNVVKSPFSQAHVEDTTIDQYTMEHWSKWEDKTAIECGVSGRKMSYRQLRERSRSLGCSLARMGMSSSTILFILPNCPEYPLALLAALQAGITVSTASPMYTKEELRYHATNASVSCVLTNKETLSKVLEAVSGLRVSVVCTDDDVGEGILSFQQMSSVHNPPEELLPRSDDRRLQLAMMVFSSGTTGLPKGVRLRHDNIIANLAQINHPLVNVVREATESHQDVIPAVLPFCHIYGSVVLAFRSLRLGAKIVTLPKFHPSTFLKILSENKNVVLQSVPTIVHFLANDPSVKAEMLKGLRVTTCGAAPSNVADLDKLADKFQHTILQLYGMTEASPVLTCPNADSTDYTTIGYPVPNTCAKIVDPDTGVALGRGEEGELCFKGPQIMEGYHNNPQATADTIDSDGWLHTGDIGYADEQGKFFVVDRIKELIKVKGFQVAPAELETLLRQHPQVADAAVTAQDCPRSGQVPVAFLVPLAGSSLNLEEVDSWIASKVVQYKRPARMFIVQNIPRSTMGKILRKQLKAMAAQDLQ